MDRDLSGLHFTSKLIRNVVILLGVSLIFILAIILISYFIIQKNHQYVEFSKSTLQTRLGDNSPVTGIVLGSGLTITGEPRAVLQQRLDASIELYDSGIIDTIIVSGYNPNDSYNEPQAMEDYLISSGVTKNNIQQDMNGDNTHATCKQAKDEFRVDKAVVITQPGHIDRTIYLCRANDIETYGYPAAITGSRRYQASQSIREAFANTKAVFEVELKRQ